MGMEKTKQWYEARSRVRIWTVTLVMAASAFSFGSIVAETDAPGGSPAKASAADQQGEPAARETPAARDTKAAAENVGTASQAISVYVTAAE